jgi:uncharacterized glyoxalase superfamily protein PhnB
LPAIVPILRYKDAPRAIDFLETAFGFTRQMVHEGDDGEILHAQLTYGDGMVMLSSARDDGFGSHVGEGWQYVVIEDADAHFAKAKQAGAEILSELEDQDYGSRDYSARDFEGNRWSFGTYRPD